MIRDLNEPSIILFDEKTESITPLASDGIEQTIQRAIKRVTVKNRAVTFNFNGVPVIVNQYSDKDIVLNYYLNQLSFIEYLEELQNEENFDIGNTIIQNNLYKNVPEWKDNNYNVGAFTKQEEKVYLCINKVKKGDPAPKTNTTQWKPVYTDDIITPPVTPKCPDYESTKKYQLNECMTFTDGKEYISLVNNNNNSPTNRPQDWKLKT